MRHRSIPGFIPRSLAQKQFGRSKSSFIRDVDDAFARDDTEFLNRFRVMLKDGEIIDGPQATKETIQEFQSMQPRWYIATELLETRYWDQGSSGGSSRDEKADEESLPSKPGVTRLQHQLEMAEQRITTQGETISRLENDKTFLQTELENRRGEIDKLQAFFASVGEAADSAAKLQSGHESKCPKDVHATVAERFVGEPGTDSADAGNSVSTDGTDTVLGRYLPTLHRAICKLRISK